MDRVWNEFFGLLIVLVLNVLILSFCVKDLFLCFFLLLVKLFVFNIILGCLFVFEVRNLEEILLEFFNFKFLIWVDIGFEWFFFGK